MVTITFQCASMLELRNEMRNFLGLDLEPGPQPSSIQESLPATNAAAPSAPAAAETSPEKKRTRRTKAEIEAAKAGAASPGDVFATPAPASQPSQVSNGASAAPKQDVAQPAAAPSAAPILNTNKEAVHQALQNVNVHAGLPKAREILTQFKVNRISEIKEDQYKPFIEACNAAVMMA